MKMLMEQTDEEHMLSIVQMIDQLSVLGMSATRKTITEDIELLRQFGLDIVCVRGTQNKYFVGYRRFELPELKLLADAVASSAFLPKKKSAALIEKLTTLTSAHQAEILSREVYVANRVKSENESIYYIVDTIHTAINSKKKIQFKYYEYSLNKRKMLKHGGAVYNFSPYALVWNDDRYYVMGYSDRHGKVVKFRVDRMTNPEISNDAAVPKPKDFDVAEFSRKVFQMYDCEVCQVELLCAKELMKVIIDRFGSDIKTAPYDENHFITIAEVAPSPTFLGWVFQFEGRMKIISTDHVRQRYRNIAESILNE